MAYSAIHGAIICVEAMMFHILPKKWMSRCLLLECIDGHVTKARQTLAGEVAQ